MKEGIAEGEERSMDRLISSLMVLSESSVWVTAELVDRAQQMREFTNLWK